MLEAYPIRGQWRIDTRARRLLLALVVSLGVHALLGIGYLVVPVVKSMALNVVQRVAPQLAKAMLEQRANPLPKQPPREVPMVFVEVDPSAAAVEPPKDTRFYSTHNTLAANPEPAKAAEVPKVEGREQPVLRLADNPRPKAEPLQPSAPKPEPETPAAPEPEPQPKPEPKIGDLAMVKVEPRTPPNTSATERPADEPKPRKPRTIKEALQRNPALAGQRTLQQGGVERRARVAMVDAKGSPFGDYDYAFIRAVEQRWYQLLDNSHYQYLRDRQGKVVLTFRLHHDGRITDMDTEANTVGDILGLLCQRAITDPSPFPRWPTEMRKSVQNEYREVKFTFYYD